MSEEAAGTLSRRELLALGGGALAGPALAAANGNGPRVLRYAFPVAETSFDPAGITDLYSRTLVAGIFEAPLEYAFLAKPTQMRPNTAAAMPEVGDNFRHFVFELKPGTFFADDAAFKGTQRELVAADYVYSLKRHYDPRWKSGNLYLLENAGILGLSELRKKVLAEKSPFPYDTEVEGLRTLGRYRFEIRLKNPTPRWLYYFCDPSFTGALAREVVEFYGEKTGEHPVGTGPFVLKRWTRSSRIVLARNPNYREVRYAEQPPADDARLSNAAQALAGRRLPLLDEVHISIIEAEQPRWLSFLNEEMDLVENVPDEFTPIAIPNNRLAPNLAKRGIGMVRYPRADVAVSYFAQEHPLVGGQEPHKVALRRAISLAVDVEREIRLARRGQAIPAQGLIAPGVFGYDTAFKSTMSEFDRARAKALLDMHGYVDRNNDGWREQPNGEPLVLDYATSPEPRFRTLAEQWQKNMDAIGIRIGFKIAKWPEHLKASRAGKLMMWGVGWSANQPDGDTFLGLGYGPNKGQANHARFDLPAFNRLYEQQREMPDGPERLALMQQAAKLMVAHMPYKVHCHRIFTDLAHPWVEAYQRNIFVREFFKYVDVNPAVQQRRGGAQA